MLALGYQGYPAFDLTTTEHTADVLSAFLHRLPPRSRIDFAVYQEHFRVGRWIAVSDFALLGLTEAKLPSDGFSLVDPLDDTGRQIDLVLEVAGYRYYAEAVDLSGAVGDPVEFVAEPTNSFDPAAMMVCFRGQRIGYINRLQAHAFHRWSSEDRVSAVIDRVNGDPQKPRAFIFVQVGPRKEQMAA
jgi:hypothetical protein